MASLYKDALGRRGRKVKSQQRRPDKAGPGARTPGQRFNVRGGTRKNFRLYK